MVFSLRTTAYKFEGVIGRWSRLEDCETLYIFKKEPPAVYDHLDSSSIWVCCVQNESNNIIAEADIDYRYVLKG